MDWYNKLAAKENGLRWGHIETISKNLYYSKYRLAKILESHQTDSIKGLACTVKVCREKLNKDPCSLCDSFLVKGNNLIDLIKVEDIPQNKITEWFYELGGKYNECWAKVK